MESPDPKYKHKPSEKHTLEEVLKSLQDLIRNDLAEGDAAKAASRSANAEPAGSSRPPREKFAPTREDFAPAAPGSGPVNLDAVLRSLKDLISNDLNVEESPSSKSAAAHAEYLANDDDVAEYVPEDLGAIAEDLPIEDEDAPAASTVAAAGIAANPAPELEASVPSSNLEAEEIVLNAPLTPDIAAPSLPEPSAPTAEVSSPMPETEPGHESVAAREHAEAPPADEAIPAEAVEEEFVPLDEALIVEASVPPPPPSAAETTELPGDIDPELLREPEIEAAPAPPPSPAAELPPGTQQELFLDEPLSIPASASPSAAEPPAETPPPEPETPPPAAFQAEAESPEALPTIEVEEDFDAAQYFDTDATAPEPSEESITLDGDLSTVPDAPQTGAEGDAENLIEHDMELAPEPAASSAMAKPDDAENLITHDVDFSSKPERPASESEGSESLIEHDMELAPESEAASGQAGADASAAAEQPAAPEKKSSLELAPEANDNPPSRHAPVDFDALAEPTAPASSTSPEQSASTAATPSPSKTANAAEDKKAPAKRAKAPTKPVKPPKVNLDDIPVLHEVVAPPAGSILTPPTPPPLPSPDRARDLVVRAVAKLNVELRKSGGAGLDTRTILRLQQLIRQELEKDRGK